LRERLKVAVYEREQRLGRADVNSQCASLGHREATDSTLKNARSTLDCAHRGRHQQFDNAGVDFERKAIDGRFALAGIATSVASCASTFVAYIASRCVSKITTRVGTVGRCSERDVTVVMADVA